MRRQKVCDDDDDLHKKNSQSHSRHSHTQFNIVKNGNEMVPEIANSRSSGGGGWELNDNKDRRLSLSLFSGLT